MFDNFNHKNYRKQNLKVFSAILLTSLLTAWVISSSFLYGNTSVGKTIIKYESHEELQDIFEISEVPLEGEVETPVIIEESDEAILPMDISDELKKIYPSFIYAKWNTLSEDEQKDNIFRLASLLARELDITLPNITYSSDFDSEVVSRTYMDDKTIEINESMLYDSNAIFKTVAHELRHVWQMKNCPEKFNDYIKYSTDMDQYKSQWVETDAESFAYEEYCKFLEFTTNN